MAAQLLVDHFSALGSFQQLLLLAVLASLAFFSLLVLLHLDGSAIGASRARPDLEVVPVAWPLIGNLLRELQPEMGDRGLEAWVRLRRAQKDKTKSFTVTVPGLRIIDCTSQAAIEHIRRGNFSNYVKGTGFSDVMRDILGDGIFAVDGDKWHIQRRATSEIFNGNNFRGVIADSISEDITKLNAIISSHADQGEAFDLGALLFAFTLSLFTAMAFSQDIGALSLDSDAPVPFAASFDYVQRQMPLLAHRRALRHRKTQDEGGCEGSRRLAFGIIKQQEEQGLGNFTSKKKRTGSTDLLSLYMALRNEDGQPMSKQALRDAVLNLIIAGRDTTAQALSWTFFHLISESDLVAPLRFEADEVGQID